MISFSCLGLVAVVPGNPETQTVSHSFPKLWAALQRKFGTDAVYRAGCRYVFGLASRERITTKGTVLVLLRRCDAVCRIGKWQVSSASRIAPKRRQVRCGDRPRVTS